MCSISWNWPVFGSMSFWKGIEIDPGIWPELNPDSKLFNVQWPTFAWLWIVTMKSRVSAECRGTHRPEDLASRIWIELSLLFTRSVICSNERTRLSSFWGTGYVAGEYSFGDEVSNSPPALCHAGNPPSSTETLLWPKTLKVHHTLGDEKSPWVS